MFIGACQRVPIEQSRTSDTDDSSGGDPSTGDPEPPADLTPVYECEPSGLPACPPEQKCTAVSEGGLQNHFKCVPDDGALLPFDPCEPDPEGGQDQCGAGTVCLAYNEGDTSAGRCFAICRNDSDCAPGLCTESPFSGTPYCADSCDPLSAVCPEGLGCRQATDRFLCEISLEVDMGENGANCSEYNLRGCADTYACMPGALIPGCGSSTCCTNTCELAGPDSQCQSPSLCAPLFPEPAPGFEGVGACFVPA